MTTKQKTQNQIQQQQQQQQQQHKRDSKQQSFFYRGNSEYTWIYVCYSFAHLYYFYWLLFYDEAEILINTLFHLFINNQIKKATTAKIV